jgi:hypothetical protein
MRLNQQQKEKKNVNGTKKDYDGVFGRVDGFIFNFGSSQCHHSQCG